MISGEIKRYLRDDGMIKVSRSLKELSYKMFQAREELVNQYGREPTIEELSEKLQVEKEEIAQAMEAGSEVESIYKPIPFKVKDRKSSFCVGTNERKKKNEKKKYWIFLYCNSF